MITNGRYIKKERRTWTELRRFPCVFQVIYYSFPGIITHSIVDVIKPSQRKTMHLHKGIQHGPVLGFLIFRK